MEDPVVPLERYLYGHPLAGQMWERQFQEVLLELGWESTELGMSQLFVENKDYSYRYTWMVSKWLERNTIWLPCGRN